MTTRLWCRIGFLECEICWVNIIWYWLFLLWCDVVDVEFEDCFNETVSTDRFFDSCPIGGTQSKKHQNRCESGYDDFWWWRETSDFIELRFANVRDAVFSLFDCRSDFIELLLCFDLIALDRDMLQFNLTLDALCFVLLCCCDLCILNNMGNLLFCELILLLQVLLFHGEIFAHSGDFELCSFELFGGVLPWGYCRTVPQNQRNIGSDCELSVADLWRWTIVLKRSSCSERTWYAKCLSN